MKILVADDQVEVRSALRLVLEQQLQVCEVDEAADIKDLLQQVWGWRPDLVLLDWELPQTMTPRALINALRTLRPEVKVVALSGRLESHQQALLAGVDAFISKSAPPEHLLSTLNQL